MQKKLLALAVAGALVPAAAMAQSSVEIYGRANLGVDNWKATGATAGEAADFKSRMRVFDNSSRVGFRVNESLGGGLRAFVVIETGVQIDTGQANGQGGQANPSAGTWASRDSYLGVGGEWGDVRFGRQSIWWSNGVIAQTGANYINTAADSIITGHGFLAAPVTRQSSVVSYNSPTFSGFNASISYSPQTQETATAGSDADGDILGVTARYTSGALRGQFDWATAKGNTPAVGDQTKNTGIKLGVGWAYAPGSQISGIIGQLENKNKTVLAVTDDAKVSFWLVNWEHMIGQWQLLAQYYSAGKVDFGGDVDNSQVKAYTIAAKYFLSKRTGVYVSYNAVKNEEFAWADHTGGGYTSGPLGIANAGADPQVIAVGVMHNF